MLTSRHSPSLRPSPSLARARSSYTRTGLAALGLAAGVWGCSGAKPLDLAPPDVAVIAARACFSTFLLLPEAQQRPFVAALDLHSLYVGNGTPIPVPLPPELLPVAATYGVVYTAAPALGPADTLKVVDEALSACRTQIGLLTSQGSGEIL